MLSPFLLSPAGYAGTFLCISITSIWTEYFVWEGDGKVERRGGGRKKNKGKMDDRRQKVEEGDTSKRRSFCGR